ncbi:MAG: DUF3098 domain-containing protein [Ginsengibacter sp.]
MKNIKTNIKVHHSNATQKVENKLFTADNFKWMLIGLVVMAIGFFLMAGGKSADPNVFNDQEIYSFRRITLAPILIVAGLVIEIYAIMKKSTTKAGEEI